MLSAAEQRQIAAANASGKPTFFFIHGLWLLAGGWHDVASPALQFVKKHLPPTP